MKKLTLIFFALLSLPILGFSQVSGYQGKRFIAGYELSGYPTLAGNSLLGGMGAHPNNIKLLTMHTLHVQYQLGRRIMIGVFGSYGVANPLTYYAIQDHDDGAQSYELKLQNTLLGMEFTAYSGPGRLNTLAPVGKYVRLRFASAHIKATDPNGLADFYDFNITQDQADHKRLEKALFTGPAFNIAFGNSRIVKNRIFFDFNLQFQLALPLTRTQTDSYPLASNNFVVYFPRRYFAGANIGIGGLLF